MNRYTAIVRWRNNHDTDEEIDIDAMDKKAAKLKAEKVLASEYEPGGKVVELIGPRIGLYM